MPADRPDDVETLADLAQLLRSLRRRDARCRNAPPRTYRELAADVGCSHTTIADYFGAKVLPPTDRFDVLVRLLGATPVEQGEFATARDRIEDRRRAEPSPPLRQRPVPQQLPGGVRGFVGRAAEMATLDGLAAGGVVTVTGTAGVGKTALALHWGHRVAHRFPDGQLYVNLCGFDPTADPVEPAEALRGFLDALDVPPARVPQDHAARAGLFRTLVSARRMLVVLDNARDAAQVRPLLPGAPGCLVVVTGRSTLVGLVAVEGAHPLVLEPLTPDDGRKLLERRLGTDRVAAEPTAADRIVARCAHLPLALAVVAARAATSPRLPLTALAEELGGPHRLDAVAAADPASDLRRVFTCSSRALSPPAARLFRLLGLHPGTEVAAPAAASLAGVDLPATRRLLAELAAAHLVSEPGPGRYACHDLLRAHATEEVHAWESEAERCAAQHRMLDHYLHTAHAAAVRLRPHRDLIALPPPGPGVTPAAVTDLGHAMDWFKSEHRVLLALVDRAEGGDDAHTWRLAWAMVTFLERQGYWPELAGVGEAAVAAAGRLGDRTGQAHSHRGLGLAYIRLGRHEDALAHLDVALRLFTELDDDVGAAGTQVNLAGTLDLLDRHRDALTHAEQAYHHYVRAGQPVGQANALNTMGWLAAHLGDHEVALAHCRRALATFRSLGDTSNEAATWDSLGFIHHRRGRHRRAMRCYRRAVELHRHLGDRGYEAEVLVHLGDACDAAGDAGAARDAWRHALAIFDELDRPDAAQVRRRLAG